MRDGQKDTEEWAENPYYKDNSKGKNNPKDNRSVISKISQDNNSVISEIIHKIRKDNNTHAHEGR